MTSAGSSSSVESSSVASSSAVPVAPHDSVQTWGVWGSTGTEPPGGSTGHPHQGQGETASLHPGSTGSPSAVASSSVSSAAASSSVVGPSVVSSAASAFSWPSAGSSLGSSSTGAFPIVLAGGGEIAGLAQKETPTIKQSVQIVKPDWYKWNLATLRLTQANTNVLNGWVDTGNDMDIGGQNYHGFATYNHAKTDHCDRVSLFFDDFALNSDAGFIGGPWYWRVNVNYVHPLPKGGPVGNESDGYAPVWKPQFTRVATTFWYAEFGGAGPAMTVDGVIMNMVNAGSEIAAAPLIGGYSLRLEMYIPYNGPLANDAGRLVSLTSVGVIVE